MAGHSKWANIQHRKGRQDAARSKLFSKLSFAKLSIKIKWPVDETGINSVKPSTMLSKMIDSH